MTDFSISDVSAGLGRIGICPMPGRYRAYGLDMTTIRDWQPDLVLSMTELHELEGAGAADLETDLASSGCDWLHLPITDFGAPTGETLANWPAASAQTRKVLRSHGRVLAHCFGGCGRSGMAIVRILVEMGEPPEKALARLRAVRACAVETEAQLMWAKG
jgi:protein-tyrosine phosphatase